MKHFSSTPRKLDPTSKLYRKPKLLKCDDTDTHPRKSLGLSPKSTAKPSSSAGGQYPDVGIPIFDINEIADEKHIANAIPRVFPSSPVSMRAHGCNMQHFMGPTMTNGKKEEFRAKKCSERKLTKRLSSLVLKIDLSPKKKPMYSGEMEELLPQFIASKREKAYEPKTFDKICYTQAHLVNRLSKTTIPSNTRNQCNSESDSDDATNMKYQTKIYYPKPTQYRKRNSLLNTRTSLQPKQDVAKLGYINLLGDFCYNFAIPQAFLKVDPKKTRSMIKVYSLVKSIIIIRRDHYDNAKQGQSFT
jgi:hypothetical protein